MSTTFPIKAINCNNKSGGKGGVFTVIHSHIEVSSSEWYANLQIILGGVIVSFLKLVILHNYYDRIIKLEYLISPNL